MLSIFTPQVAAYWKTINSSAVFLKVSCRWNWICQWIQWLNRSFDLSNSRTKNWCPLAVEVQSLGGRKLLLTGPKEDSRKNKERNTTMLSNKTIGIVVPGILALCCVLICPCFYAKRKEVSHTVLENEISSGKFIATTTLCFITAFQYCWNYVWNMQSIRK